MLEWEQVTYRWSPSAHPLGPISGRVPPSTWLGLIGPNGAGKSTLLRLTAAFLTPASGSIRIQGHAIQQWSASERARWIAMVPQVLDTPFDLTVQEVVELGRLARRHWHERFRWNTGHLHPDTEAALDQVGLWELRHRPYATLSGGEAKRVLLAAAIVQHAPVLLLDEPTAHLDPGHARQFLEFVNSLVRHHHTTVVMAYHDLTTVGLYVDQLWVMDHGQLLLTGDPDTVLNHPALETIYQVPFLRVPHPRTARPLLLFP